MKFHLRTGAALAALVLVVPATAIGNAPTLEQGGVCSLEAPKRGPTGHWFRACYQSHAVGTNADLVLERFKPDGSRDTAWAQSGIATIRDVAIDIPSGNSEGPGTCAREATATNIFFPAGGRILVRAGQSVRFRAFQEDGVVDAGYSADPNYYGPVVCRNHYSGFLIAIEREKFLGAAMLSDGSLVSVGYIPDPIQGGGSHFYLRRISAEGVVVPLPVNSPWGSTSYRLPYTNAGAGAVIAWAISENGKLAASYVRPEGGLVVLQAANSSAAPEVVTGRALPESGLLNAYSGYPYAVFLGDGSIVASPNPFLEDGSATRAMVLRRFLPTGDIDTSYGVAGSVMLRRPWSALDAYCGAGEDSSFALQPDGSVVTSGQVSLGAATVFLGINCGAPATKAFAAKVTADGRLDPFFPNWGPAVGLFDTAGLFDTKSVTTEIVEYYNSVLDHYFLTGTQSEVDFLDKGQGGPSWARTGKIFQALRIDTSMAGTNTVCRYYGGAFGGPNSHFYSALPVECDLLATLERQTPPGQPAWRFERDAFRIAPPTGVFESAQGRQCASTLSPIYRVYSNRQGDPNHRYVADQATYDAMIAKGWVGEGIHLCAMP